MYKPLKKMIFSFLARYLRNKGKEIVDSIENPANRRGNLLSNYGINCVFDVGANIGQYAMSLRRMGYSTKIISFEPVQSAFLQLRKNAEKDKSWQVVNMALGDFDGEKEINIAELTVRSSFFEMSDKRFELAPNIGSKEYKSKEVSVMRKFDSIYKSYLNMGDKIFLKIDTQGYEKNVLNGAQNGLDEISGIQLELSLVELYKGEETFIPMIDFLYKKGFVLQSIEPGFYNPATSRMLQFDGIFFKHN